MKKLLLLSFLVLQLGLFGQKKLTFTFVNGKKEAVSGLLVKIKGNTHTKYNQEGTTNQKGQITFTKPKTKNFNIVTFSKDTVYKNLDLAYNPKDKNIYVPFSYQYEMKLLLDKMEAWKAIDAKYDSKKNSANSSNTNDSVYRTTDQVPEYIGGFAKMSSFIRNEVVYPNIALELGDEGKVFVQFIVQKDGQITHCKVMKSVSPELDFEAIRVIRAMPKWIPGEINNKPAKSYFTIPINFKIG